MTFSCGELAWTDFLNAVHKVEIVYDGFRGADVGGRIHATQKPVALYDWLLANYAEPGQKILDTHMGSGSIAIACHYAKCHLTASELDEGYFNAACERIERRTGQLSLF